MSESSPSAVLTADRISFTHPEYPTACISPNLMTAEGAGEYPGFGGTLSANTKAYVIDLLRLFSFFWRFSMPSGMP
jgi:hypothetical protein